ncbi:FAD-binding oxidoreductase [Caballeronia sp. LjRoot34]|uniref:FAD-binding oxidoreductase n=1 Tax=Caballeronia sp. LjRoot34 TaxID=3342325 RepID=UPI003ECEF927
MNTLPGPTTDDRFEAEVLSVSPLNDSVMKVRLMPLSGKTMKYSEGQFLSIELPDGDLRSYSMASASTNDRVIELHIRLHRDGKFSRMLRNELATGDTLKVHGPFGTCVWQTPASEVSAIVMLATGTGIAPLNALLEAALQSGCANPVWLYWGATTEADLYLSARFASLAASHRNFHYVPVLSGALGYWQGKRGFVQDAAAADHPDLSNSRVYACGAPSMITAARDLLVGMHGLDPDNFLSDSFVASAISRPADARRAPVHVNASLVPDQVSGNVPARTLPSWTGDTLLAALRDADLVKGVCGGNQSCGTCRVTVEKTWFDRLMPAARTESRLLQSIEDSGPFDRLACQIVLEPKLNGLSVSVPRDAF